MSYTSQTKGDRNKAKFQASNINNVFKGKSTETQQKVPHRQYGMQVLGRVSNVRRMPRPSVLPSLKAETGGNDPRVNLVPPGGQGWGGSAESGGMLVRNSRAEALLDSPPHSQSTSATSGSSAQGGRAGGTQSVASSGAEARSWSRVTGGNAAGVGGPGGGGGGGSGSSGGTNTGVGNNSGGGHNGWAPASGGSQALSTASQRDFPKLGASTAVTSVNSSDTSLRPQGSLSVNWRDRGRTGGVTVAAPAQQSAPLSPTSAPENVDVSGGGAAIASQGVPVSGGSRTSVTSTNSRLPSHLPFSSSAVGGNPRTFAETGSNARFDGTGAATSGGAVNRIPGKMPPQTRTSAPLRTTLDDKAASTAPTGWAADQGELDFSERIVFSDEEDDSPLPSKPKQMVGNDKVIGSNTNGDHSRQMMSVSQISPELHLRGDPSLTVRSHGVSSNDIQKITHRSTGQVVEDSNVSRKPDEPDSIGIGAPQRSVVGLMQIPGPTPPSHHITLTHPHQSQQHSNFAVSAVREAWPSGPAASANVTLQQQPQHQHQHAPPPSQQPQPQQQSQPQPQAQQQQPSQHPPHHQHHHQQHQGATHYPPLLFTNSRVTQGPYGAATATSLHPTSHPFSSNPGPLMSAPVPNASQLFAASNEDKHLSDQRNLHQKEFKNCVERARMKKRTDESDVRGGGATPSSVEEDREIQRQRPRQRFDAPSTSSKGSMNDIANVDDCESRSLATAPREETGPPGGPPMPPVPIVAPPQPPAHTHSYPVHGLPTHFGAITQAAAHFGPRGPWHGAHPPGATAATYPHPAAQHPTFPHPYPPPASIPTYLLDPNIRPKNTQEYTALMEKFQEFLMNESKRSDKNGKAEGDRTGQFMRQVAESGSKKVVEQADPFAEEDSHENRETTSALASGDVSSVSSSQQSKVSKRESHMEPNNLTQSNATKRPQAQISRDELSHEHHSGSRRIGDVHQSSSDRDSQASRGGPVGRSEPWEERDHWLSKARETDNTDTDFGDINQGDTVDDEIDTDDQSNDRKRTGSRDNRQLHQCTQKKNRNAGDYSLDQQGKRSKNIRGHRGAMGGTKMRGRGASASASTYQAAGHNFGSEEELARPPRGGSAGQLSRSSSSLAERSEWPVDEIALNTGDSAHRQQYSHHQMSQQALRKASGGARRGGASSRGMNPGVAGRSRDYSSQPYATWGGSTSGTSRSYNSYHRMNSRNYSVVGNRRYPMEHYSQSPYYDDYSYGYDYSMDEFGGQWQLNQPSERSKQSQQQGRRDSKKTSRDRITQNRSSAPPAGVNERSDSSHQPQQSVNQQSPSQSLQSQSQHSQQSENNPNKQGRRDQQNRNREQSVNKNAVGPNNKGRAANKKQGSTESNTSSSVGDSNSTVVPSNTTKQTSETKSEDDKSKDAEEKAVIQLQPAPAPTVNVWNTKHPLIANTLGGPTPVNQSNETPAMPVDLMATPIPIASELRTQSSTQNPIDRATPKPLIPLKCESAVEAEDGNSASEATTVGGSESRRGRETSKSRRDRTSGREHRQSRGERRGSSRRGGAGTSAGSAVSGNTNQGLPASAASADTTEVKHHRDHHSQVNQNEEMHQRARRRRPNKDSSMDNVDDQLIANSQYNNMWFQVYADDEYGDYDYGMSRNYMSGRFNIVRPVRGTRGYRGYHYRSYGSGRNYYQNYYPGSRSYYPSNQRYYGNQSRYRGGGSRTGSSGGNYDGDSHGTGVYVSSGGGNKRQGSVSKETVTSDGNEQEDWETASESSDVANRDTRRRPPSGGSGGGGGAAGGGGSGGSSAATGGSVSSSGNSVNHQQPQQSQQQRQRGRQQKSGSGGVSSVSDEKLCEEDSGSSTPQQTQRKRNRMEGIDLNNFASVVAVDNLPEVTVDEEFLYDNAAEFVEVLSKNARKTKKREEMKQKQEQELQRDLRSRQTGRRNGGGGSSDGLSKRRNTAIPGSSGSGSGSGSPPKRLQSSKMTADERRRQKKAATSIVKPSGMVKPLLSSLSDQGASTSAGTSGSNVNSVQTTYLASNNSSVGGTGRSNKTKLPPRLAKQQQQQQQHVNTTTNAPPLMSLDSAELEQSILAADLSAGRKCQTVSAASVTDFKIESWDNSLAEDIPKVRRNADQQLHAKGKAQTGGTDSPKSSVLAPIAPPSSTNNGITSAGKADSGVDTGGEVSDRSSHSSGGATTTDNRTHSPQTTSDSTVTGQSISTSLLEASVTSSLQTGDTVVDSSNEEYKLPDGFVLSCQRVTGDYDEMKASAASVASASGSSGRVRSNPSKISEISAPVHEVVDSSKASEVAACSLAEASASVTSAVSKGTSDESMPMSTASVSVTTGSGQSSTVEEGTTTLNKKIALVKSCWPEANDKPSSSVADTESGSLLSTGTAATTSSTSVIETETAVSSAVVISNVCKVKPQQKLADPSSSVTSSTAVDEVNSGSVSVTTSSVSDVHDAQTIPVFPGVPHLSTLPSSAPSFVPKAALFQQANPQDSILTASGNAGVMFASTGGFQHLPGPSAQPRGGYGPPGGAGAFGAAPQPTNVGRPNLSYSSGNGGKCPPVSLSIPIAQQNATAKALGLGIGFGMSGNGGGDPSLLGHGAGTSSNAAVAALLQRQNSNSVGVIGPPTGPSTPQCSNYQPYNIQGSMMSNAAAAAPSAATPTGGSWPTPYGPNLSFTPGLHNPSPGTQQAAAWTFLKNQNPSGPTGPAAPGLPSPNTPSPAPSRQPLFFNLWPIAGGSQAQQPAGSASQQANLGTTGTPLFGTSSGSSANKFPGTNPAAHSSQLGAMPPPNLHNLVSLPQFRGGIVDNNTNCNVQSSIYDANPFPHQHQPTHQQQQPSFPPFPDFTSFSQSQLPLKPPPVVAHGNAAAAVPAAPSPQQMDILTLLTNEFNSNRGTESKTPTLSSLCMTPFSQPTQPHQQPPQHSTAVSRHAVTGLNTNMGLPHPGLLGKQNTMDLATAGMNAKPPSGWGPTGVMPVSSASHIPSHVSQNVHHSRSLGGPIVPPRSSPTIAGVCGSALPSNSQSAANNRRVLSSNSISHNTAPGTQPGCANQQYSGQNYKSYGGSNYSNRGGSVGYSGHRGSRGARGAGGHTSRGAVYGGSYRNHRTSNSAGGMKPPSQTRSNNYGSRTNTSHPDVSSRRIPAAQNLQSNEEESDIRTVDKPVLTNTPATTSATSVPSHSSNEDKSTANVEKIAVTLSGCGDNSLSEPMNSKPNDSSGDIELDSTNRSAISLSPSPSDIMKNGQQVDSAVLLLDGTSEKFETVTLPSSVIQNNESSSAVLSVTPSTGVVDF